MPIRQSSGDGQKSRLPADRLGAVSASVRIASPDRCSGQQGELIALIERELIPRLMLSNRQAANGSVLPETPRYAWIESHVGEFADLIVQPGADLAIAYFERMRDSDTPLEALFEHLLAPAARRLGALWDDDIYSFVEVTVGLSRLQQLIRANGSEFDGGSGRLLAKGSALLMPVPGEKHMLGISIVESMFRHRGWDVCGGPPASAAEIAGLVASRPFDVVGLSASRAGLADQLSAIIRSIRRQSCNPGVVVLVGGGAFFEAPRLAKAVGADATGTDALQVLRQLPDLRARSNN